MVRQSWSKRIATVYFPSEEELQEWTAAAHEAGVPLSAYIREMVAKGQASLKARPRADHAKELEDLRRENAGLVRDAREKTMLLEHYETELFKLRNQIFREADSEGLGEYDPKLLAILREGKTIESYRLLTGLGINPRDSDAVKLVKNQLEEMRRFGLVTETPHGWRWVG